MRLRETAKRIGDTQRGRTKKRCLPGCRAGGSNQAFRADPSISGWAICSDGDRPPADRQGRLERQRFRAPGGPLGQPRLPVAGLCPRVFLVREADHLAGYNTLKVDDVDGDKTTTTSPTTWSRAATPATVSAARRGIRLSGLPLGWISHDQPHLPRRGQLADRGLPAAPGGNLPAVLPHHGPPRGHEHGHRRAEPLAGLPDEPQPSRQLPGSSVAGANMQIAMPKVRQPLSSLADKGIPFSHRG